MIPTKALRALKLRQLLLHPSNLERGISTSSLCNHAKRSIPRNNWHSPIRARASSSAAFSTLSQQQECILNIIINSRPGPQVIQETNGKPRILATSAIEADIDQPGFISRIIQWCKDWFESLWEAIQVTLRVSEISIRLSPLLLLSPAALVAAQFSDNPNNPVSNLAWTYLMHVVQVLGPGYVKLCQWIATRRDIFPRTVCDRLSQLHDKGYPHSLRESDRMLKKSFGDDYEEHGLHLDEVIGCGSAAQVHKGTLTKKDEATGEETVIPVAVKILHPWFKRQLENDLWLMEVVAKWMHALPSEGIRMVNLPRAVSNFGGNLRRQSDLTVEANNLKQFRRNFYGQDDDESTSAILFPQPKEGWVSEEVLVEDLVENAVSIAQFLNDETEAGKKTRKELATPLLNAFLKMVFQDNFTHGDIHAGNCLIQTVKGEKRKLSFPQELYERFFGEDNSDEGNEKEETVKRSIVFLDAGIVTRLDKNDQRNLKDLFRAVISNDGYEAGRLMVERARYERCSEKPGGVEAFATGVGEIVSEFHDRRKSGLTLGAVRIGSLLGRVLDLCRVHGVEIDPAMSSIVVSTLVLEGLGRSLEPSLNLMDCAVPFILGRGRV